MVAEVHQRSGGGRPDGVTVAALGMADLHVRFDGSHVDSSVIYARSLPSHHLASRLTAAVLYFGTNHELWHTHMI